MGINISWPAAIVIITGIASIIGWIKRRSISITEFDCFKEENRKELTRRFESMDRHVSEMKKNVDLQINNIRLEVNTITTKLDFFAQTINNLSNKVEIQTKTIEKMDGYREGYQNGKKTNQR